MQVTLITGHAEFTALVFLVKSFCIMIKNFSSYRIYYNLIGQIGYFFQLTLMKSFYKMFMGLAKNSDLPGRFMRISFGENKMDAASI